MKGQKRRIRHRSPDSRCAAGHSPRQHATAPAREQGVPEAGCGHYPPAHRRQHPEGVWTEAVERSTSFRCPLTRSRSMVTRLAAISPSRNPFWRTATSTLPPRSWTRWGKRSGLRWTRRSCSALAPKCRLAFATRLAQTSEPKELGRQRADVDGPSQHQHPEAQLRELRHQRAFLRRADALCGVAKPPNYSNGQ